MPAQVEPSATDATLAGTLTPGATTEPRAMAVPERGAAVGRYLVLGELGRGAMGAVFAAYDGDLDRKVAIKLVREPIGADDERRRQLLSEAQAMARIHHPNVVSVYDAGVWGDRLYVAMELVEGVTLDAWRSAERRGEAEIVRVCLGAAEGLAAAHRAGIVHRDFKPGNVLVTPDERVVVVDFGLAMTGGAGTSSGPHGGSDQRRSGTPAYMSPEHFAGGPVDARSDQFAFCVTLFEMLTGRRPFTGGSMAELAAAITEANVGALDRAALAPRLRRIVLRGLSPRAEDRHGSIDALAHALRSAIRPRWPRAAAAAIAVVAIGALAWAAARPRPPTPSCVPGSALVAEFWGEGIGLPEIRVHDATPAWSSSRATVLRQGIDDYLMQWAQLHDEHCRVDGPAGLIELARAACIEDRRAAGRGLVEFLARTPIDADAVDGLLETLPPLDDCRGSDPGAWEPVPSDPAAAREVAALRGELDDQRRRRLAGVKQPEAEVDALLEGARATGFGHLIAQVQLEHAAVAGAGGDVEGAQASVDEALRQALTDGHDRLAAAAVNRRLLLLQEEPDARVTDARRWARLGEALAERRGTHERLVGDLANNLSVLLLQHDDASGALIECRRAEEHYGRALGPDHRATIGARVNCAGALARLHRFDEADALLTDATARYDVLVGREHPMAIATVGYRMSLESQRGNYHRALAHAEDALARHEAASGAESRDSYRALHNLAFMQAACGHLDRARASLARLRASPSPAGLDLRHLAAAIAMHTGDDGEAIRSLEAALAQTPAGSRRAQPARLNLAEHRLLSGDVEGAAADLEVACAAGAIDSPSTPAACPCLGAVIAVERGDSPAAARWLARCEALDRLSRVEEALRSFARVVLAGRRDPDAVATVRALRDETTARSHALYPDARLFDRWLVPGATPAVRPRGPARGPVRSERVTPRGTRPRRPRWRR